MTLFRGETANVIWTNAARALSHEKGPLQQSSRVGPTKEILHAHFCLTNARQRWVSSRLPAINPAFAVAEFFWILAGSNESSFINRWFPRLAEYQGSGSKYHGAYGHRIRNSFGFDQLEHAYRVFQENPDSRQVVLQIWNPELDFPNQDGSPSAPDIPCNLCSLPKVRDGRLEWLQIMRSNDIFRGMPYNVVQFTMLQETLAGWLGLETGEYHQISDSLHYYEKDATQFSIEGDNAFLGEPDSIALRKDEHERVFKETYRALSDFSSGMVTRESLVQTVSALDLPQAYKNLVTVATAEIARREKWYDTMETIADQCSDSVLSALWRRWLERVLKK